MGAGLKRKQSGSKKIQEINQEGEYPICPEEHQFTIARLGELG